MIELINFIKYSQDFDTPVAVLACAVDFEKAFNKTSFSVPSVRFHKIHYFEKVESNASGL